MGLRRDEVATIQIDRSCAAIIRGLYHKRYGAKQGKIPLKGAIP